MNMRAMVISRFGEPRELRLEERPIPEPAEHEVQIALHFAAVNPVDSKICRGGLQAKFLHRFPITLGWEGSGVVSKVGSRVTQFQKGDEVCGYFRRPEIHHGAFAEYISFPAEDVVRKPQNFSLEQAANFPLASLTGWQTLVEFANAAPGERVLVHGGGGSVGSYAIQLARHLGCTVYTTARERDHSRLYCLGAQVSIDYQRDPVSERILEEAPEGVDILLDSVRGSNLESESRLVRSGGRLVSIVQPVEPLATRELHAGFVSVVPNGESLRRLVALAEEGVFTPPPIHLLPLERAAEAMERCQQGGVGGKLVLQI